MVREHTMLVDNIVFLMHRHGERAPDDAVLRSSALSPLLTRICNIFSKRKETKQNSNVLKNNRSVLFIVAVAIWNRARAQRIKKKSVE